MFKRIIFQFRGVLAGLVAGFSLMAAANLGFCGEKETDHATASEKGPAILLVAFGTSIPRAQAAFDTIEARVKKGFPDIPVHWAYTSYIIRQKLAAEGKGLDSPKVALAKLRDQGYTKVVVQSLHMIPGFEFHDIYINAMMFERMSDGFDDVIVSSPLLASNDDMEKVIDGVIKYMVPKERKKDEAVVLMGHGTHHSSDAIYTAMMYKCQQADPNIFVGTVEGHPTFDDVKALLKVKGIKKAYLMPLMSVAGDHALNDLAGDEADSWKSMLTAEGVECVPVLKGVAEFDPLADLWVDHLKIAMKRLK